ncbi:MAG: methylmalonyl-CoA mutase family protein [Pseudomonadota bacterium]
MTNVSDTHSPDADQALHFDGFARSDQAQWRALAAATLNGADFDAKLVSKTIDGIALQPVYARARDDKPVARLTPDAPWRIGARVDHPDPDIANALVLSDLEGGADLLSLVFPASHAARGFGLGCDDVQALDRSLKGVGLDMIRLRIEPAPAGRINAATVAALVDRRGHSPANLDIDFALDPIGSLVTLGALPADWPELGRRLAETVSTLTAKGYRGPFLAADTRPFHEAGAGEVHELAAALAIGVSYMRALEPHGIPPAMSDRMIGWTFAVDTDQFLGLAKLRAFRTLWSRVQQASGLPTQPVPVHAETAWRMMTRQDPSVNMLRATIAGFTASIGGADSLVVLPHTLTHGLPTAHARRVARNLQLILAEESNLWRVADPAAGSGALADLTDALCAKAWDAFQRIESDGGIVQTLEAGTLQAEIATLRARRLDAVAKGKTPITGTSSYPLLDEPPVQTFDVAPDPRRGLPRKRAGDPDMRFADLTAAFVSGSTRSDLFPPPDAIVTVGDLPSIRLAEPFEDLRARARAAQEPPRVFLAGLGSLAEHGARATWITNFLAAGGIEAVNPGAEFHQTQDVGAAFAKSGCAAACICGTDESYALLGDATAQALQSAGATHVMVAGRAIPELTSAAVNQFVYAGCDAIASLQEIYAALGVN